VLTGCSSVLETGAADPRSAVVSYVEALNLRDGRAIADLAPPLNDPWADIRTRLAAHGGQNIRLAAVEITNEISPKLAKAHLTGRGRIGDYEEILFLVRKDDRWFIVMGANPNQPNEQATAATTRP
jgi:hypothetical protein